jgi:16S rRNA (guanine527-N7)-methyltransferase
MNQEQLTKFVDLLIKWQAKVNLISNSTKDEIWNRHIKDSLQLAQYIPQNTTAIIDLGSGGGLPAVPLAVETKLPVCMVESDRKKCLFLQESIRLLELKSSKIINSRIESATLNLGQGEITHCTITARALADLNKLFEYIKTLLENNKITSYTLILPKGKTVESEISEAKKYWDFSCEKFNSDTSNEASILVISHFEKL